MSEKYKNRDWLEKKYHEDELTQIEISNLCDTSTQTICNWMRRNGINARSRSERELSCSMKHESRDWLLKKKKDGLKKSEMADVCGCSKDTIDRRMSSFGISQDDTLNCSGKHRSEDWLIEKYHRNGLTMKEVAEECGCTQACISEWLQNFNIKTQSGKFKSGENHWNYKNGDCRREKLDFRKSDEWKRFSLQKKKKADWMCEYCLSTGRLHTHHVKPVSMGGDEWDNEFIVLCKDCHIGNYGKWHPPILEQYI